ncbi:hypothetical protein JGC44_13500 [Salmonella enterica subsp. enterica serovar Derby]|nr:hypothetical protein [Citrobacter freundii]MBJ3559222.1 hypothetical protein [Salmonella enterica subsp. enterica serovar Derby]MBJ4956493.1 hypothetical protein [Salmonella enterica subsp. enterica serovar Goldcoast]
MSNKHLPQSPTGEFILFASGGDNVRIECRFESDILWPSQTTTCERHGKDKTTISKHKITFEDGEPEKS